MGCRFWTDHPEELRQAANVGWGCVDKTNLDVLLELHTAESSITERPMPIARMLASNLLDQLNLDLQQAVSGKPVPGAISHAGDRALFLIGHDTNITSVAGLLNLDWIADGRTDDTPPGGALIFELWQSKVDGKDSVRVFYTTQTLEQMRNESPLSLEKPPVRVPLFVPGCSRADFSCPWLEFERRLSSFN